MGTTRDSSHDNRIRWRIQMSYCKEVNAFIKTFLTIWDRPIFPTSVVECSTPFQFHWGIKWQLTDSQLLTSQFLQKHPKLSWSLTMAEHLVFTKNRSSLPMTISLSSVFATTNLTRSSLVLVPTSLFHLTKGKISRNSERSTANNKPNKYSLD